MSRLSISLLGPLQVTLDDELIVDFATDKVRALLAYLVVESGRPHRREKLAGLLWPEQSQQKARQNLRKTLARMRQVIGDDQEIAVPFLLVSRETLQFNAESNYWLDVAMFTDLAKTCKEHRHRHQGTCLLCMRRLAQMTELYRGDFLDQFFLKDSESFEEWSMLTREWLHRAAVDALAHLARYHERRGEYSQARAYAWKQVELDPWREESHRHLMRLLALDGQRSAALTQYQTCRRSLADELGVEPTSETTSLYEQIRADEPLSPPIFPHNLPPSPTPFVGREDELEDLVKLLADPDRRLLSLVGPGGIGKTRLALQAAQTQIGAFVDGVNFASLASISSVEFLLPTLANALNFSFQGHQAPQEQLLSYLKEKDILLVLDNLEHLLKSTELLAQVLQRAPGVVLLVTSRERLNLQEEWVYDVEGLSYPANGVVDDVEGCSAIELFYQSARRAREDFVLEASDIPYVVHICQLVEGMPLAIELAAAGITVCSLRDIIKDIKHNFDILSTFLRNVPERHRSVRAIFEQSWNLLTKQEQQVFARLSVFQGGFERQGAQQVAKSSLPILTTLIHKSLLRHDTRGRYQFHQLLRQFAAEKQADLFPHTQTTHHRHAEYYAEFLQQREDMLKGGQQRQALQEISVEIDNIRVAWKWAIDQIKNGQNEVQALNVIQEAAKSLSMFYPTQGLYQEGKNVFGQAVLVLDNDFSLDQKDLLLGRLLVYQGKCCEFTEHSDKAAQLFQQSLNIFQQLDARHETALPLHGLGYMAHIRGEYVQAERYFQDSMTIYEEIGDTWGVANVLSMLCLVERRCGAYSQAKRHAQEALVIRREIGDQVGIAANLKNLGLVDCDLGEYGEAKEALLEALEICYQFDHKVGIADTLTGLCQTAFRLGDIEAAQQYGKQSLAVHQEIGDYWGVAISFNNLGYMALELGEYRQAKTHFIEGVAIYQQIGIKSGLANTLCNLGETYYYLENYSEAKKYLYQALQIAQEIGAIPATLKILVSLVLLWIQDGKTMQSLELLAFALDQSEIIRDSKEQAKALFTELTKDLAHEVVAEAIARGQACKLDSLVANILGDEEMRVSPSPVV